MISRRGLLAGIPAALPLPALSAVAADFERIDTHTHVHRPAPALLSAMASAGWKALSICDSREMGDEPSGLPEMIRGTVEAARSSQGRFSWATTFDPRGFEQAGFAERTIAGLRRDFDDGAIAVKIWKNIGMGIRSASGEYLLPDHPALAPIFDALERAGKPVLAHLADPDNSWKPLDPKDPESGYLRSHPEWLMHGRAGAPSKEAILQARDRVLARRPKLRLIGCHLGSNEENLQAAAKRLDALPNLAVDLAARVRFLVREPRETARQFLLRYSDRILYATDFQLGSNEEAAARNFVANHELEWSFLASGDSIEYHGRKVQGLGLGQPALRRIFRENARRWLPGM